MPNPALVVTSISAPNPVLRALAEGASAADWDFLIMGDTKSPGEFALDGAEFYAVDKQIAEGARYATSCPTRSYARKNIGYLVAIERGAPLILETDDDNFPREGWFTQPRDRTAQAPRLAGESVGWINAYRYFSDNFIWPRGLPLDALRASVPEFESLPVESALCPIQQGLADENPDVDALYRLMFPLPQNFRRDRRLILGPGAWCPFNSQNTAWWPEAYPLMYLPAHCSFRMTDIWRSFVAQRISWVNGWNILFHEPNVWQERNEHDLMRDFADEVPGYLHNRAIGRALDALELAPGVDALGDNLRACYGALVSNGWVGEAELPLLEDWLADLAAV